MTPSNGNAANEMSGNNRVVLDANVLIYMSKGQFTFQDLVNQGYDDVFISVMAYMEVLGYAFSNPNEEWALNQLTQNIPILQTDMEIAGYVIGYRRKRRIKLPDAIILATARKLGADLMTKNVEDFQDIDEAVRLVEPF